MATVLLPYILPYFSNQSCMFIQA